MTTPQQQILNKCKEVQEIALRLYGVDLSVVRISFDLKGRTAGWAQWKRRLGVASYACRFNYDMIARGDADALNDMRDDTVPHELAHIVCYMKPELGKSHDGGWQRVCRALGGTGKRTHSTEVVYGHGITYEYTTDRGCKVRLNERGHQAVLRGQTLSYRKGLGTVRAGCAYSIVGHAGRTLAAPIVKQAVNHPALVEEAVRAQRIIVTPATKEVSVRAFTMLIQPPPMAVVARPVAGESKAAVSRRIMLSGTNAGHSYEQIINAMMLANGYDRQLARATYKANAPKLGLPVQ